MITKNGRVDDITEEQNKNAFLLIDKFRPIFFGPELSTCKCLADNLYEESVILFFKDGKVYGLKYHPNMNEYFRQSIGRISPYEVVDFIFKYQLKENS